jgi:hypothetical protein
VDFPPEAASGPEHYTATLTKEQSEILRRGWQRAEAVAVPTITQALTHAPSDRDTVTGTQRGGDLAPLHLPYRWGAFQGWAQVLVGAGCMFVGLSDKTGVGLTGFMVAIGALWVFLGYGVLRRKKFAVILMLGLQGLMNLVTITQNFANVIGLAVYIPNLIYFVKRMDEMD